MSFLGRAKRFLQDLGTESPSKTQTFNLACASGHRVRGERTEGYQALRCPSCGEGVFVLPRSPLPEPEVPAGAARSRGAAGGRPRSPWADEGPIEFTDAAHEGSGSGGDGAEIIWDDESAAEEAAHPGAPARPRVSPEDLAAEEIEAARRDQEAGRRADARGAEAPPPRPARMRPAARDAGASSRPEPAATPGEARPARPRRERAGARAPSREPIVVEARPRTRSGPRVGLIFAMLALLIVGTIGIRSWRNLRAQYPQVAQRGRDEGIPALEAGEFDHAFDLLSAARRAVDALGGAVEGAGEIRQAADEAAVYVDLCPESLEDLLDKAARRPDEWQVDFDKIYRGRYFLFSTFVLSTPDAKGGGSYELGYVVLPRGEASRFGEGGLAMPNRFARIDLTDFELFNLAPPSKGDQVTFGARLLSIERDPERKQWVVRLDPKGGVYITHTGPLTILGWPDLQKVELPKEDQP